MKAGRSVPGLTLNLISAAALFVAVVAWLWPSAGLPVLLPSVASAQQDVAPKRVLVLFWGNKDFPANALFDHNFQSTLQSVPEGSVEYYSEYIDADRFPGEHQFHLLRDYLRQKYADRTIDVVVASGDIALNFLLKYRNNLFAQAPIVFVAVRPPATMDVSAGPGITGCVHRSDYTKTLDLALRLHPDTERVFVVSGSLERDKRYENICRTEFQEYETRVLISYLTDFTPDELIDKLKSLPERSIVLYVWQQIRIEHGRIKESREVLDLVAASSSVPIYGVSSWQIGGGIIGGHVRAIETTGVRTAEMALRIINGVRAQDIPVENVPTLAMFDWRELRRWGISEDRLPAGSTVRFKKLSFWDLYRWQVIGVISLFLIEAFLIFALLAQRSKRGHAEQRLRLSEEKFANAFRASPDALALVRWSDGIILEINDHAEALLGYKRDEVIGRTTLDFNVYVNREDRQKFFRIAEKNGSVRDFETDFRSKAGALLQVSISAELIAIKKDLCLLIIVRDITERKRAAEALRQSEERLRLSQRTGRVGTWEWNLATSESNWSEGIYSLLGIDAGDGRSTLDEFVKFIHPEDRERTLAKVESVIREGEEFNDEFRIIRRDGAILWLMANARVVRDASGKAEWMIGVNIDITERKRAEATTALLAAIVESSDDAIISKDLDSIITTWNRGAEKLFGYTSAEAVGKSVEMLIPLDRKGEEQQILERVKGGEQVAQFETVRRRRDGTEFEISLTVSPIRDKVGQIIGASKIARDITERKRAEQLLQESEAHLLSAMNVGRMYAFAWNPVTDSMKRSLQYSAILGLPGTSANETYEDFLNRVHPEDRQCYARLLHSLSIQSDSYQILYRVRHFGGAFLWVEESGQGFFDANGVLTRVVGMTSDITERKRAESLLNAQYATSHALSEATSFADAARRLIQSLCECLGWEIGEIWRVDREANLLTCIETWHLPSKELAGFASARRRSTFARGTGLPGSVWQNGKPAWITDFRSDGSILFAAQAEEAGVRSGFSFPLLVGERVLGTMALFSREERKPDEGLLEVAGSIGRQIGQFMERRQSEDALRESEERFRAMADTAPVLIWVSGPDSLCSYFNRSWLEMTGRTMEQEMGYGWINGVHPDDVQRCLDTYVTAFYARHSFHREYRIKRQDGEYRWLLDTGVPRSSPQGTFAGYIGSAIDITERKAAEDSLRKSEEALRESYDRIEDLAGRLFVAQDEERKHIARELHDDLNQQVAALAIGLDRLEQQIPESDAPVRSQIVKLEDEAARLSQWIRRLSHELHSSVLQHVGLSEALRLHCSSLQEQQEIAINLNLNGGTGSLSADVALCLDRVAQEALRNIAKHSGAKRAELMLAMNEKFIELRIADQGKGFDVKETRRGEGLGLVSMEERIRLMGGKLEVESEPGAGTELRVYIPLEGKQ